MTYQAPVNDILFSLLHVAGLGSSEQSALFPDATPDLVAAVLAEAGRFASERIAPLNRAGDRAGARLVAGAVATAPGWRQTYADWIAAGWNSVAVPPEHGGQGLPFLVNAACLEMWNAASMAFGIGPVLTMGAVEAMTAHASPKLAQTYLAKLVSGEWTGTMNLTEPQAGSDLAPLRTRAHRQGDGSYRLFGQKIFITYGEHDLTDNIIHFVLARLPDAPEGTRGISLFLVPKYLPDAEGRPGQRNDVVCSGLEHKLGIHASPTCVMTFGDRDGAIGYLVGEEHKGLACMFTMMNNARLAVGLQGVGIADRAFRQALTYARQRQQGHSPLYTGSGMSPIIHHPDIRRMLMEMRARTVAARGICYQLAAALDSARHEPDPQARQQATFRAALLTPVAKAFATDMGHETASIGIQVHGGTGYIEETGAAQHYRDARIAAIYEGTNGIQAIDLVTRKLGLDGGRALARFIATERQALDQLGGCPALALLAPPLQAAIDQLEQAAAFMVGDGKGDKKGDDAVAMDRLAGATPFLRLFGIAAGGSVLAREALAAIQLDPADEDNRLRIATARFYATQIAPQAEGLARAATSGYREAGLDAMP